MKILTPGQAIFDILVPEEERKKDYNKDDFLLAEEGVPANWMWLYDTENWSDFDWTRFKILYSTTPGKKWADYVYALRQEREYLERHGINRSDIHDPRKLFSIQAIGGLNWTGTLRSIERLYK